MSATTSQITSLTIVYSPVYSGTDQRKHQSSASLAFVQVIHRGPVNSLHKGSVTREMFPFDDVIILYEYLHTLRIFLSRISLLMNTGWTHSTDWTFWIPIVVLWDFMRLRGQVSGVWWIIRYVEVRLYWQNEHDINNCQHTQHVIYFGDSKNNLKFSVILWQT